MNYDEYSSDWKDVIRPAILKRDNYCCRVCGIRHKSRVYSMSKGGYRVLDEFTEEWAKSQGKSVYTLYLVVAHLDQNRANNDPQNLLTLCPQHHGRYDREHKAFKRKVKMAQIADRPVSVLPGILQNNSDHLSEIIKQVREFTAVSISRADAEILYSLTLNFLQNVKN